jgi:hypothetical protein
MRFSRLAAIGVLTAGALCAAPCTNAPLNTYLNGGAPFTCSQGSLDFSFNHDILPSYVGLNLLSSNNSSADPANINVTLGSPGLFFNSNTFSESNGLAGSQAELVHFLVTSNAGAFNGTSFSLAGAQTGTGPLSLGTGLVIGQEIVCVGGTFTSLPVGLITTVANGVVPGGVNGCNGVTLVGTAAVSSGPLSALTGLLGLPNLAGLTDQAQIQFLPADQTVVDVIKIQALVSVLGGTASTTGFGDNFATNAVPEPSTLMLSLCGAGLIAIARLRKTRAGRSTSL